MRIIRQFLNTFTERRNNLYHRVTCYTNLRTIIIFIKVNIYVHKHIYTHGVLQEANYVSFSCCESIRQRNMFRIKIKLFRGERLTVATNLIQIILPRLQSELYFLKWNCMLLSIHSLVADIKTNSSLLVYKYKHNYNIL